MCGFAGMSLAQPVPGGDMCLQHMADAVSHRGPDAHGTQWIAPEGAAGPSVGLGFRRLAVRDLDARANQPMCSASRDTWVVFNGEIYNSAELRKRFCDTVPFRTTSDTEILLECFERLGSDVFPLLNGMFAVAFVDSRTGRICLARDRTGKKPLYLFEGNGFVAFASELRCFQDLGLEFDPENLPFYLQFGHYPAPLTAYRNVTQLRPGEAVVIKSGRIIHRHQWHDFSSIAWGTQDAVDDQSLDELIADAVSIRTLSDVPIGVFLSGGVDSSLVAAQLAATGRNDIPAFTVAFDSSSHNEAPWAAAIAGQLGLEHIEIRVDAASLPDQIVDYVNCYEQPFADSSGLPSLALCKAVRQFVTVALCGDGGDEFYGGYKRYAWYHTALKSLHLPRSLRHLLGVLVPAIDPQRGRRLQRLLDSQDASGLYAALMRAWPQSSDAILDGIVTTDEMVTQGYRDIFATQSRLRRQQGLNPDARSSAQCADAMLYLPGDLQVKMDRASMQSSLEVRCPLLDFRVAEAGASLASSVRYRSGLKCVLKRILARHVSDQLFDRPKQGFSVPMREWLRGPLRSLVLDTLRQRSFQECGWINARQLNRMVERFDSDRSGSTEGIWMLLILALSWQRSKCFESRRWPIEGMTPADSQWLPVGDVSGAQS